MMRGTAISLSPISGDQDYELLSEWSSSPSWVRASGRLHYLTPQQAREMMQKPDIKWLMIRTHDGRPIGALNWQELEYQQSFMIGTMIGDETLWGAGYGVESIMLAAQYLFHANNAHKIQFIIGAFNKAMIELWCQGPIQIEGILRDHYFMDNAYHDAIIGSILRDEYYALLDKSQMPITDAIPDHEKFDARKVIRQHLTDHPITLRLTPGESG
jgi:RimJ/RimL family protein N-acetyltransferase